MSIDTLGLELDGTIESPLPFPVLPSGCIDDIIDYARMFFQLKPVEAPPTFNEEQALSLLTQLQQTVSSYAFGAQVVKSVREAFKKIDQDGTLQATEKDLKKSQALNQALIKLGSLVYVAQRNPAAASTVASSVDVKNLRNELMLDAGRQPKLERFVYAKVGLHDPDRALTLSFCREIGAMLVDTQGQLNLGMIPIVLKHYTASGGEWADLVHLVLGQMDASWQSTIDTIQKPPAGSFAEKLLRAEIGASANEPLTDLQAKRAAIATLLAPWPQETAPRSFATAWEVKQWNKHALEALQDLRSLFAFGAIERRGEKLFALEKWADPSLKTSLFIGADGKIQGSTSIYLWDYPPIIAACKQLGIDSPEALTPKVLELLGKKTHTCERVIEAFAEVANVADSTAGKIGFSTGMSRLLSVVDAQLMALGEMRKDDVTRAAVINCARKALQNTWNGLHEGKTLRERVDVFRFQRTFEAKLQDSLRLAYDPVHRAFHLHETNPSQIGMPIQTGAQFASIAKHAAEEATNLMKEGANRNDAHHFAHIGKALSSTINSVPFTETADALLQMGPFPVPLEATVHPLDQIRSELTDKEINTLGSDAWVYTHLVEPGRQIAAAPLSADERRPLQVAVRDEIASLLEGPELQAGFIKQINRYLTQTKSRTLSLTETCQGLVDLIAALTTVEREKIEKIVDRAVLTKLPAYFLEQIREQIVPFGTESCAYFNPRTQDVEAIDCGGKRP